MAQSPTPNYISIGKIAGTHGLKGEVVLKHALGQRTALKDLKTLFIKDKTGSYLPWFLETAKIKSETETFVKLESLDTVEGARSIVQKEVWLAAADFEKHAAKNSVISFIGYIISDNGKELGQIEEIIEQPHQVLCRLNVEGKEVLIPLHEETLQKVDAKAKIVYVSLPDGLLDIYLS
ncbi:ribosome maturation factor RimM [Niabella hibiscisoli]|uniref:ribosome maturation factor RimM n=1 Tax=Niabella hibiscisoli TaxID=1825928 RepID=UPI001F0E65D1|nr:ribosome maturation factor RimM [Niabella hibiscisoli]MCH5715426.1 ribosome maturation factor RimM [Niabella hibiscisoli]